jgi:16S rRNA (uracil1498-N3)-methyltransferase
MAIRSVYLPQPAFENDKIYIAGEEHKHLTVARAEPNELLEIMDGRGTVWTAVVETISKHRTAARITGSQQIPADPVQLTLALALIRMPAFELALEKVVEVGVSRIVPFTAERSNVSRADRSGRWLRIVIEAAKQSKRYHLPSLDECRSFDHVISMPAASKIMFAERDGGPLKSALAGSPVLGLIGPEGGWTARELSAARENGFHPVSLGASILKAETAAIVGASLIQYELGK